MSDKYRPTNFYNGLTSFKTAFPQLSDALIAWSELRGPEDTATGEARKIGYRRGNFTHGLIPCSNPLCHEGGYEIDKLVAYMLDGGETEREGVLLCVGRELGDEMRRGPVRCPHRIQYSATLVPRTEDERPSPPRRPQNRRRHRGPRRSSAA